MGQTSKAKRRLRRAKRAASLAFRALRQVAGQRNQLLQLAQRQAEELKAAQTAPPLQVEAPADAPADRLEP